MNGVSAVTTPTDEPTIAPRRSRLTVMPSMQLTRSVHIACCIHVIDWKIECAITGSKAFSCSCPPSTAMVTVISAPTTANATWLTTSGMRSEEHTSELQSLMHISYAVFCLQKQHIYLYRSHYYLY